MALAEGFDDGRDLRERDGLAVPPISARGSGPSGVKSSPGLMKRSLSTPYCFS
jgi:hypothetical protein